MRVRPLPLLTAGAALLLGAQVRTDLRAARVRLSRPAAPVRTAETSSGVVSYAEYGTGPAVLVLHGNGGGFDQGVDWARRRLGRGRRVISPSRFGYPGSALPADATTADQADALAELLTARDVERADVVTLSAGSAAGLQLAIRHPDRVRSLVLEAPVVPAPVPAMPPRPVFRAMLRSEVPFWLLTRVPALLRPMTGGPWRELGEDERREFQEILATTLPVGPRVEGTLFDSYVAIPEVCAGGLDWNAVRAPTLVITAENSTVPRPADAAALVERLPDARLVVLPGGGHTLLGNVPRLRAELDGFLATAATG